MAPLPLGRTSGLIGLPTDSQKHFSFTDQTDKVAPELVILHRLVDVGQLLPPGGRDLLAVLGIVEVHEGVEDDGALELWRVALAEVSGKND